MPGFFSQKEEGQRVLAVSTVSQFPLAQFNPYAEVT